MNRVRTRKLYKLCMELLLESEDAALARKEVSIAALPRVIETGDA